MKTMYSFALLLVLLCSVLTGCTDSDANEVRPETTACGTLNLNTRNIFSKIEQGTECSRQNSPVVALTILPVDGGVGTCSGTLITPRHILTAAHCFDFEVRNVSVQIEGVDFSTKGFTIHPDFDSTTIPMQNDVAILELVQTAPTTVRPQPLILSAILEPEDKIAIFGYGQDGEGISGILRSGEMIVTGINSQFFFANFERNGSNVCQGDSGGPAIYTFEDGQGVRRTGIIGITSFGSLPCSSDGASGFQNIQSNATINFITSEVPSVVIQ